MTNIGWATAELRRVREEQNYLPTWLGGDGSPARDELIWAAGFFDGEGNAGVERTQRGKYNYLRLQIGHVRPEPIERFIAAVGKGRLLGPYANNGLGIVREPIHRWRISGTRAVEVAQRLWPHLSTPKREQILTAATELGLNLNGGE